MTFHEVTIGDYFDVKHGYAFKGEYFTDSGPYIVVTPGNFFESGGFRLREGKEKFYVGEFPKNFLLEKDDLIIAMTQQGPGLLGSSAMVPEDNQFLHNQRIGLVTNLDESKLCKRFLYYLLNTRPVRGQIEGSATGSKVKHTAPKRIKAVRVEIPSFKKQERIAEVLTAHDEFIENNRRRIAFLEEAAEQVYKEWFVRFRFPGNESTTRKDGIPSGWRKETLGVIAPFLYGKALKASDRVEGEFQVYGSSGVVGTHASRLVDGPGIIIGRKGNVGSVYWECKPFWPIDTVYFVEPSQVDLFIYYSLRALEFISSDVAVPGLNRNHAHRVAILVPTPKVKDAFVNISQPIHDQINNLHQQNARLSEARNLLLPRLMSGEIQV